MQQFGGTRFVDTGMIMDIDEMKSTLEDYGLEVEETHTARWSTHQWVVKMTRDIPNTWWASAPFVVMIDYLRKSIKKIPDYQVPKHALSTQVVLDWIDWSPMQE